MKTEREVRDYLAEKAQADSAFRERLIADPRAVVESEFQVTIPAGIRLHVHQETLTSAHLVLPPDGGLTPDELRAVSGGSNTAANPGAW